MSIQRIPLLRASKAGEFLDSIKNRPSGKRQQDRFFYASFSV